MPHIAGHDPGDVEYADHEVQALGANVTINATGNTFEKVDLEPVSERGIDSDEVAELVAMYRTATLTPQGGQDQTSGDSINAEFSFGINTNADSELLADASSQATIETSVGSDGELRVGEISDPGVIDTVGLSGSTGNSYGSTVERFVNFQETLGTGPFVDKTDDLVLAGEIAQTASDNVKGEYSVIMYWNVHEMPEGRASFSRP